MSNIYIKGQKEALVVSEMYARKVKILFDDSSIPKDKLIADENTSFYKGEIRSIKITQDENPAMVKNDEDRIQMARDLQTRKNLSPTDKAKQSVNYFKFVYFSYAVKWPTRDEIVEAVQRAHVYYNSFPKRSWCDPAIWKDMIESKSCNETGFQILRTLVAEDAKRAKY